MLLKVLEYIKKEGCVSNQQIARALCLADDALQPMLEMLQNRGLVHCEGARNTCHGCSRCDVDKLAYFSLTR